MEEVPQVRNEGELGVAGSTVAHVQSRNSTGLPNPNLRLERVWLSLLKHACDYQLFLNSVCPRPLWVQM